MSIGELGRQTFCDIMGVKLSTEELGRMGKRMFQQAMGVVPKKSLSERAADITRTFERWGSVGINVKQISRLQKEILRFAEEAFALHYPLNSEKLALQKRMQQSGMSRETFDIFRSQSRQYVVIRNWNDKAQDFIDKMKENLSATVEDAIVKLTPDSIRNEDQVEWVRKTLALFSVFNDRLMQSLTQQFDEIQTRCGGDECSNYLLFCFQDVDAKWNGALDGHREVDQRLTKLLDQRVEELTS